MLVGVVTRRDLARGDVTGGQTVRALIRRDPVVVYDDSTLREAADAMVHAGVGRLPVVSRRAERTVVGIVTRSDLLGAHARRLAHARIAEPTIVLKPFVLRK
jgi:CBS domain-containing protein